VVQSKGKRPFCYEEGMEEKRCIQVLLNLCPSSCLELWSCSLALMAIRGDNCGCLSGIQLYNNRCCVVSVELSTNTDRWYSSLISLTCSYILKVATCCHVVKWLQTRF
jgi:hypothetical protein